MTSIGRYILTNLHTGLDKTPLVAFSAFGMAMMYPDNNGLIKPAYTVKDVAASTIYASLVTVLAQTLSKGVENIKNAHFPEKPVPFVAIKAFGKKHFATTCLGLGAASIAGIIYGNQKKATAKEGDKV